MLVYQRVHVTGALQIGRSIVGNHDFFFWVHPALAGQLLAVGPAGTFESI